MVYVVAAFFEQAGDVLAGPTFRTEYRHRPVVRNVHDEFFVEIVEEELEVGDVDGGDVLALDPPLLELLRRARIEQEHVLAAVDAVLQLTRLDGLDFDVRFGELLFAHRSWAYCIHANKALYSIATTAQHSIAAGSKRHTSRVTSGSQRYFRE